MSQPRYVSPVTNPSRSAKSVLILTADTGSGHRTNVDAIERMLASASVHVEVSASIDQDLALRYLPGAYRWLNHHARWLFALYFSSRATRIGFRLNRTLARWRLRRALRLDSPRPDVIVVAHSIYCQALDVLAATGARVVVVVVDLSGGPVEWYQPGADLYVLQSQTAKALALAGGAPPDSAIVRRVLPVNGSDRASRHQVESGSGSSRTMTRLVILGGGNGVGPILEIVRAIQKLRRSLEVTVICGNNPALVESLNSLPTPVSAVHAYVPNIAARFADFDLVITKPGSVTLIELLYSGVPFVLMRGIPGVEASNEELLSRMTGLPVISDGPSASELMNRILDPDLRLSPAGLAAFALLREFAATLPRQFVTADEVLGSDG